MILPSTITVAVRGQGVGLAVEQSGGLEHDRLRRPPPAQHRRPARERVRRRSSRSSRGLLQGKENVTPDRGNLLTSSTVTLHTPLGNGPQAPRATARADKSASFVLRGEHLRGEFAHGKAQPHSPRCLRDRPCPSRRTVPRPFAKPRQAASRLERGRAPHGGDSYPHIHQPPKAPLRRIAFEPAENPPEGSSC